MIKKIKLIALDLDDTLLLPDRTISEQSVKALAAARQQGVMVVLATGRMFRAAVPFAQQLQLDLPLIAYQGALIKTTETREVLRAVELTAVQCHPVLEFLAEKHIHANLYIDDELYIAEMNEVAARYASFSQVPVHVVGELTSFEFKHATKIVAIGNPLHLHENIEPQAKERFGSSLTINTSRPHFLEFGHPQATKSSALAFLGKRLGIAREEMLAIGDGANDLDMIEYAGIGVAMGNADDRLKAVADYITTSNVEEGVAKAIEWFCFSKTLGEKVKE
ncbi:MAG: Cof-type HAD-IIB family hydrolase [Bacillota bacterium]|nr:Cof-type HAD-IIB family hydrolase [Bacillota bacterium]